MFYVYILTNKENTLYKGFTKDLKTRFASHNSGKVRSTKLGRPWRLIYYQAFENETDARREEIFLKSGKGRERLKYLLQGSTEQKQV